MATLKSRGMKFWAAVCLSAFSIIVCLPANGDVTPEVALAVNDSYMETDRGTIQVGLNYLPGTPVVVKLTVTPPNRTNPGELALDSSYKTVPSGYPALGDNEYYVSFKYNSTIPVGIASMDGTYTSSMYGFTVKAEVVTPGWSDAYVPATQRVYVQNVAPTIGSVTPENPNAWMVAGGVASMYPISWSILSDVEADLAAGITVRFSGCVNAFATNITEATSGSFVPEFGSWSGSQSVTMTIEDKDGASQMWTYLYYVQMPPEYIVADGVLTGAVLNDATKVEIPQGVVRIGESVFADCSSLTSVVIPDSVTNIADNAFRNCILLTSVVMEGDCPEVGVDAFYGVDPSCVVRLPANNSTYTVNDGKWQGMNVYGLPILTIVDGVLTEVNLNGATNVVIPSCVTNIGEYAFGGLYVTGITIPDSVTSIREGAFARCSGLTSVTIPDSVTNIGASAFYDCNELTSVTIGDGVTSIEEGAFDGCSGLTSVTIPNSVQTIGENAFWWCDSLTNIVVMAGDIGEYAFGQGVGCDGMLTLVLGEGVTSIGRHAFAGCYCLRELTVPSSVTNVADLAFQECCRVTNLTINCERAYGTLMSHNKIYVENRTVTIGEGCRYIDDWFGSDYFIRYLEIGSNVETIGDEVFSGCDMTEVQIPDSVTDIGTLFLANCHDLTNVVFGAGVTNIGGGVLAHCENLKTVVFKGSAAPTFEESESWDSFFRGRDISPDLCIYVAKGSTGWGVDIPGMWNGARIEYYNPSQVAVEVNGAAVEFAAAEDGKTRTAEVAAGTAAEDVKVFVGGVDVTAGFKVAVEGTTATVVLLGPYEAARSEIAPYQAWTDNGDGNVTLNVKVVPGLYYAADSAATIEALKRPGAAEPAKAGDAVVAPKQTGAQGFYKVWVSDAPIAAE